ncbi:alpha/beta hydrolase [Plantactinospora sp. B5E13]|uniref:alpha/beta fold hydrolase n=1 Tax=unclassified Plantactinospora TaxID=2631981 RepID=UPI00325CC959
MRITVRDLTFDLHTGGPADGGAVLLLHGFPQHGGEWDDLLPTLHAAGLRTLVLDQRGYSPQARPTEVSAYQLPELVADAVAVLDALDVPSAHVVGHDWGAAVAWRLAADHPDRVRTLTAVSVPHPAPFGAAIAQDPDQQARSTYMQLFRQAGEAERVLLADDAAALRRMLGGLPSDRIERYVAPMREPGALTAALNWYRAMSTEALVGTGPVAVPTTFVWGDTDMAVGPVAARNCAGFVTGDYRFVPLTGVGHWVPETAAQALADAVLARITDTR